MKKYWNRFLNWLIPNRRQRIISEIMKADKKDGLYNESSNHIVFAPYKGRLKIEEIKKPLAPNINESNRTR